MSIDYSIYIGPYVRCKVQKKLVDTQRLTCPNKECNNHCPQSYNPFCPLCGSKIEKLKFQVEAEAVDTYNIFDYDNEKLTHKRSLLDVDKRHHIFISNRKDGCHWLFDPTEADNGLREYGEDQRDMDLAGFRSFYGNELAKLREVYGEENVSLHWGVIHTAS